MAGLPRPPLQVRGVDLVVLLHPLPQARRSKWLVLLTANTGRRSLDRSQARVRSVVGTSLGRVNCRSLFAGSLLGSSTCSIGPASGLFRGAVFCSKKWLVLKPLISTFSGWFFLIADNKTNT